jgi:hypothetical protein
MYNKISKTISEDFISKLSKKYKEHAKNKLTPEEKVYVSRRTLVGGPVGYLVAKNAVNKKRKRVIINKKMKSTTGVKVPGTKK